MRALHVIVWIMLVTACSSPKKYSYYFDRHQVVSKVEETPVVEVVAEDDPDIEKDPLLRSDVPPLYASANVDVKPVEINKPKEPVKISDPKPKKEPKTEEEKRVGLAVFGFIFSGLGAFFIPFGYGIFLAIAGVAMSILGLKSKRRLLALLGVIIGGLAIVITLILILA